jgi:hypothetical protein
MLPCDQIPQSPANRTEETPVNQETPAPENKKAPGSATTDVRENREGHPCPRWCATGHGMPIARAHWGAIARIDVPGASCIPDTITARAVHLGTAADRPEVA